MKTDRKEPTSCGHCEYDEAEGGLVEQCLTCKGRDMFAALTGEGDETIPTKETDDDGA